MEEEVVIYSKGENGYKYIKYGGTSGGKLHLLWEG